MQAALVRCLIVSLLLETAGCAWFGEETTRAQLQALPEMSQTLQAAQFSQSVRATADAWPEQRWWQAFGSASLDHLIDAALSGNPDLKAAAFRVNQSQAMVDAQGAELYPTVDANVSFNAQRFSANSVQVKYAGEHFRHLLINPLILRYHLDFWGRDAAVLQGAVGRSLAVAAEWADAKLILAASVAGAYFDLEAAAARLAIVEQSVVDRRALLKLAQSRLAAGLTIASTTLQANMALQNDLQQQAVLAAEVELHRHRLAALTGQGSDAGAEIAVDQGTTLPPLPLPGDLPLKLLSRRPDLTAARLNVEAAAEDIKVAETAFYPDVNLLAFTGLHSVSLTDIVLQGSSLAYAVGPSIEFPIFEGGRLRASLSYQQAAYDAAVERYNAGLVHAVQEVADALSRWRELEAQFGAQQLSLADAEANSRLNDQVQRNGLDDKAKPLLARLDVRRERLLLIGLEAERLKTAVSLIKALGGGYDNSPVQQPIP